MASYAEILRGLEPYDPYEPTGAIEILQEEIVILREALASLLVELERSRRIKVTINDDKLDVYEGGKDEQV